MLLHMRKKSKYILALFVGLLVMGFQPVWAGGPPAPSIFSNPLAVVLIILMVLLLIIIGVLSNVLIGLADLKVKKRKKESSNSAIASSLLILFFLLSGSSLLAQNATAETTTTAAKTIGGMDASTFYLMTTVIFIELGISIALLINIKFLLQKETKKVAVASKVITAEAKKSQLSWWDRFNKLRPVSQEAELDLGHDYDGIRELNNRLPPWWLYGFYLTILFAVVYLWRFHVSHNGPSSKQEYETSVARAEIKISNYLKTKGESVDENTVTLLTSADEIAEGKAVFMKSCVACHLETGAGSVGPNLTDDYWLHGNDIKSIFKTIRYGINAMPQWQNAYSNKQIAQVASYVKSLHGTNPLNPKKQDGIEIKEEAITVTPPADSTKTKVATRQ